MVRVVGAVQIKAGAPCFAVAQTGPGAGSGVTYSDDSVGRGQSSMREREREREEHLLLIASMEPLAPDD